jgi:hypothetical protein
MVRSTMEVVDQPSEASPLRPSSSNTARAKPGSTPLPPYSGAQSAARIPSRASVDYVMQRKAFGVLIGTFPAVGGLVDHFHVGAGVDQDAERRPQQGLVVGEQDTDGHGDEVHFRAEGAYGGGISEVDGLSSAGINLSVPRPRPRESDLPNPWCSGLHPPGGTTHLPYAGRPGEARVSGMGPTSLRRGSRPPTLAPCCVSPTPERASPSTPSLPAGA